MIRTHELAYAYPGAAPLAFPDLDVPQGAVVLVSGPSGSGKSTWLGLLAALVPPASGQLEVAGQTLNALRGAKADAWRARAIGFLPQKLHLSAALNVRRNLALAQWAAGQPEDPQAIERALAALDVGALALRMPSQLSGGQAQRVALARAVLLQPQLILADEPTASLDDDAADAAIALLLGTAQRLHATLVIATHDQRVAPRIPAQPDGSPGYTALRLARPFVATN